MMSNSLLNYHWALKRIHTGDYDKKKLETTLDVKPNGASFKIYRQKNQFIKKYATVFKNEGHRLAFRKGT